MDADFRDRKIIDALSQKFMMAKDRTNTAGEWMLSLGRYFLGTPYAAGTLEKEGPETLVINLRQFDCFTFVENIIALTRLLPSGHVSFDRDQETLTSIRYRRGRLDGYASRLHYFSDWLFDNQRKGIVKNISRALDGQPFSKKIDFMTGRPDQCPALTDRDLYRQMQAVERRIQKRAVYYIPKASVITIENQIADGDLIAVTPHTEGLDVVHVGIAVHVKQKLHLLHASSHAGRVIISTETLDRYLDESKNRTGIMAARVVDFVTP
jgi:hypothetical protein